jgi:5-aminopentanamidase
MTRMNPIRVAAVQAEAAPGDVPANVATAARLVGQAAASGATIVVLPELFLSAYHPPVLAAQPATDLAADDERAIADARLDPLRVAARDHRTVVIVGAPVRQIDGRRTCSLLVVDRSGAVTAAYDKQQLWGPDEQALFAAGEHGATLTIDDWRFGLGICYDGCFPEHGRAVALAGADGYLVPSGYVLGSEHRRDIYYAARALDNTMYVVFANSVAGPAPWTFNGGAAIYEPEGRALGRAPDTGEHIVVADLDPAHIAAVRAAHSMLSDRRTDLGGRAEIAVG